jgi:hypothetical protein
MRASSAEDDGPVSLFRQAGFAIPVARFSTAMRREVDSGWLSVFEPDHIVLPVTDVISEMITGLTIREDSIQRRQYLCDIPSFIE